MHCFKHIIYSTLTSKPTLGKLFNWYGLCLVYNHHLTSLCNISKLLTNAQNVLNVLSIFYHLKFSFYILNLLAGSGSVRINPVYSYIISCCLVVLTRKTYTDSIYCISTADEKFERFWKQLIKVFCLFFLVKCCPTVEHWPVATMQDLSLTEWWSV